MKRLSLFKTLAGVAPAALALLAPTPLRAETPEPVGRITPPAGWSVDVGRSTALERSTADEPHFGGVTVHVSAQHLYAPGGGGLLLVTEIATAEMPGDAPAAAAAELQGVAGGIEALGGSAKVTEWKVAGDAAKRVTEGRLIWTDDSLGTTTTARTLVFAARGHLVRIEAACIIAADHAALRAPCEAALATLEPLAPVAERVELVVPTVAAPATPSEVPAIPRAELSTAGPTIGELEGEMPVIMTVDPPKKKSTDRRPIYVGAGLLVLAGVYLWNRRKKEQLADE